MLSWQGIAWKGERVNLQALLWATEDISGVRVKVSDLTSEEGSVIASTAVEPSFVRYVMTDEFAGGCGKRKPADLDSSLEIGRASCRESVCTYVQISVDPDELITKTIKKS